MRCVHVWLRSTDRGLRHWRDNLSSGRVVAVLGAETSAPLYPLWNGLVAELAEAARDEMSDQAVTECQAMAAVNNMDAVVELVRRQPRAGQLPRGIASGISCPPGPSDR